MSFFNTKDFDHPSASSGAYKLYILNNFWESQLPKMDVDKVALGIGIAIPFLVLTFVFLLCCIARRIRGDSTQHNQGYHIVNHELDDEEMEFKRTLERGKNGSTQIEMTSTAMPASQEDDDDDVDFSAADLDRLDMLEKYRSNLVAGAKSAVDNENEDLRL